MNEVSSAANEASNLPATPGAWAVPEVESEFSSAFGEVAVGEAKDRLTPKILIMQPTSKLVSEQRAVMGEIINSATGEKMATVGEGFEFIVLSSFKTWVVMEIKLDDNGSPMGKPVFVEQFDYTPENCNMEREFTDDAGRRYKNLETFNFVVCLTNEIQEERAFPYVLSLSSSGANAAKAINSVADNMAMRKNPLPLPFTTLKFNTSLQSNEKGTWHKAEVIQGRPSTKEELTTIKRWFDTIKKSAIKVDNSDLEEQREEAQPIDVTPETEGERQY